jgi:MFS family permease
MANTLSTTTINSERNPTFEQHDGDAPLPSNASTITTTTTARSARSKPPLATILCFSALMLSIFLVALDTVLIPTALPTISLSFHIPDSLYAWTGSAYLLANAASVPFWGKLSDVFGRKNIILIANVIFLGGSLICAVSVSAVMLVAGRAVQGLGGGGVVVLVHVCVADMFTIRYVTRSCLVLHLRLMWIHHMDFGS